MPRNEKHNFVFATANLALKEEIKQDLESSSQKILAELPSKLMWEWDDRFDVPLLIFSRDMEEEIRAVIERYFPNQWDLDSIKMSPPTIRTLIDKTFGLRSGQTVFAADTNSYAFFVALCWPWEDGATVSLRMGLAGKGIMGADQEQIEEYLRQWFRL